MNADVIVAGAVSSLAYFAAGTAVLFLGFIVLDLLTPGKLRDLVFIENRAGAMILAAAQQIALAAIIISVIITSDDDVVLGIVETLVYGALGIVFQSVALIGLEATIPGRFRDVVMDAKAKPRAVLAGVTFVVIGVINAAALS